MFTVMFVLYWRDDVEHEAALAHWHDDHPKLVNQIPGLRRYEQFAAVGAPEGEPPFLGCATLEFDDEAAWNAAGASEEMATALADLANFADPAALPTAYVQSTVQKS